MSNGATARRGGIAADEAEKGGVRCPGESGCGIARREVSVMDVIDRVRDLLQGRLRFAST
jgi:hypothetical protein